MVLLQRIRVRRLSIRLLVSSFFLLFLPLLGGGDGIADAQEPPGSATPELRISLREAIQAAIDNNVNVRLLKERIAAAQAQGEIES
ncbi:MAG: hypothetical protein P0120_03360 [Nitrospira sp.]|nr:hypothetical protein [Nitrospira sp.]